MMNKPGNEKRCYFAPIRADHCIEMRVYEVSMSDRNTANKLLAISVQCKVSSVLCKVSSVLCEVS